MRYTGDIAIGVIAAALLAPTAWLRHVVRKIHPLSTGANRSAYGEITHAGATARTDCDARPPRAWRFLPLVTGAIADHILGIELAAIDRDLHSRRPALEQPRHDTIAATEHRFLTRRDNS